MSLWVDNKPGTGLFDPNRTYERQTKDIYQPFYIPSYYFGRKWDAVIRWPGIKPAANLMGGSVNGNYLWDVKIDKVTNRNPWAVKNSKGALVYPHFEIQYNGELKSFGYSQNGNGNYWPISHRFKISPDPGKVFGLIFRNASGNPWKPTFEPGGERQEFFAWGGGGHSNGGSHCGNVIANWGFQWNVGFGYPCVYVAINLMVVLENPIAAGVSPEKVKMIHSFSLPIPGLAQRCGVSETYVANGQKMWDFTVVKLTGFHAKNSKGEPGLVNLQLSYNTVGARCESLPYNEAVWQKKNWVAATS